MPAKVHAVPGTPTPALNNASDYVLQVITDTIKYVIRIVRESPPQFSQIILLISVRRAVPMAPLLTCLL